MFRWELKPSIWFKSSSIVLWTWIKKPKISKITKYKPRLPLLFNTFQLTLKCDGQTEINISWNFIGWIKSGWVEEGMSEDVNLPLYLQLFHYQISKNKKYNTKWKEQTTFKITKQRINKNGMAPFLEISLSFQYRTIKRMQFYLGRVFRKFWQLLLLENVSLKVYY